LSDIDGAMLGAPAAAAGAFRPLPDFAPSTSRETTGHAVPLPLIRESRYRLPCKDAAPTRREDASVALPCETAEAA